MNLILKTLETTELNTTVDIKLVINSINSLFLLTDCQSWKALQKNLSMKQLFLFVELKIENCCLFVRRSSFKKYACS